MARIPPAMHVNSSGTKLTSMSVVSMLIGLSVTTDCPHPLAGCARPAPPAGGGQN